MADLPLEKTGISLDDLTVATIFKLLKWAQ